MVNAVAGTTPSYSVGYNPRVDDGLRADRGVWDQAVSQAGLVLVSHDNGLGNLSQAIGGTGRINGVTSVQFREFTTPQDAAAHAVEDINPTSIAENTEYTGKIRMDPMTGLYYATPPIRGTETNAQLTFNEHEDALTVGDYHTHGNYFGYDGQGSPVLGSKHYDDISGTDSENFSRADRVGADMLAAALKKTNYFLWLGTPSGAVRQYSTETGETTTIKRGGQD